jgi:FSR family fosmidomycin resistance protein-like MFS transporter
MVPKMQKTKIALGSTTHMVTDIYASFIVGMIPILTARFGLSLFLVSLLTSVSFISANLTQPVFGYLSDKYGVRNLLVAGPLIASIFLSMLGIAPAYWVIIIFLIIGKLGVSAIHPPGAAIANYFGGKRKGFANSLVSFGGTVGFSLGSLFIIYIIEKLGLNFTPIAAIPGIIIALIMVKYAPDINIKARKRLSASFWNKLKKVKRSKIFLLLLIMFAAYSRDLIGFTILTFMPLYFTERGVSIINFGYIVMGFTLIGGMGGLISGYFSDRIQKRTTVIQISILLSIPCVLAIFYVPIGAGIFLFILSGFFAISTLPLCIRISQDIFPGNVSLASSFVLGVSTGSASATLMLIGKIADNIGLVTTIKYVTLFPLAGSLLLFLFPLVQKRRRDTQNISDANIKI